MPSLKPVVITKHPVNTASFLVRMNSENLFVERAQDPRPIAEVIACMREVADWMENFLPKEEQR